LPPLRDRTDKRELIHDVLKDEGGSDSRLGEDAERVLMAYAWPGNLRQLRHVLRSAAALADGKTITREHLPSLAARVVPSPVSAYAALPAASEPAEASADAAPSDAAPAVKLNPIQANERQVLLQMLEQHRWNVSNVAKALDVSRNTLYRKLHKLHIEISPPD